MQSGAKRDSSAPSLGGDTLAAGTEPPSKEELGDVAHAPTEEMPSLREPDLGLRATEPSPPPPPSPSAEPEPAARAPRPPKPRRSAGLIALSILKWSAAALAALALAGALTIFFVIRHYESDLPTIPDLKKYAPPQVTRVLAKDGSTLAELFTQRRTVVPIASLPAHVKLAVLAAEDAGFYEHEGVNYLGIVRALIVNLRAGRRVQGGSTITQQVVKNVIVGDEKSYSRKIREALLARRLEHELSKDEILELYLNQIYFGGGRYGIEEAARFNFGKSAKDLTIGEAALIAGIIAGPEKYAPHKNLAGAMERRAHVLAQMKEKHFLDEAREGEALAEAVKIVAPVEPSSELAPEAVELAKRMLQDLEPDRAKNGGFTIYTTIDPKLQTEARKALRDDLQAYDKRHHLSGALRDPRAMPEPPTKKGQKPKPPPPLEPLSLGPLVAPSFEHHKVYVGEVAAADDAGGTFDVKVGSVTGFVKLSDFERYNPEKLMPSRFAPVGARLRVSLLAPVVEPKAGVETPKVPLRMELGPEGAIVSIDVRTRQVLALVGAYEAQAGALDRATQARRQPGSTFKPIVYSYALHSRRFTPATLVDVHPDTFDGGYRPANYEGWPGREPMRLREVLAQSVNLGAVRVLREVGPANVVMWGASLGIQSTLKPDLSLALGSYEVHPIELAGAYATFASGGEYRAPELVTRIVGPDGKDVPLRPLPPPRRVLEEAEAYVTTSMLTSVIDHGTARAARALGRPLAGKTGTSNEAKDTWFAGYSPDLVAVVWVGYDDGKPLGSREGESGAMTALPAWMELMKAAHAGKPRSDFPRPNGVTTATIDKKTGKLPFTDDPETMDEVFLAGTEPSEMAERPEPDADAGVAPLRDGGLVPEGAGPVVSLPAPDAGVAIP